ncbi:MAG: hypothetical protein HC782_02245, partial [Gammaproteobacteria bacterium]|nr:hypothetical protein [Gammaproteobacteria bacterium]
MIMIVAAASKVYTPESEGVSFGFGVAMLRHSNIVQVFDFDISDDQPYIIMEALDGPTLPFFERGYADAHASLPWLERPTIFDPLPLVIDFIFVRGAALDSKSRTDGVDLVRVERRFPHRGSRRLSRP